jgi:hypothetical protein
MKRWLVKIDFDEHTEIQTVIVHAPTQYRAEKAAEAYGASLVVARVIGERTGPEEEDLLAFDDVIRT